MWSSVLDTFSLDCVVVDKGASAFNICNLGLGDIIFVDVIKSLNIGVSLLLEDFEVKLKALSSLDTILLDYISFLDEVGQVKHDLLGNASNINAGSSDNTVLHHADLFTEGCSFSSGSHSTTSCTNDNIVELISVSSDHLKVYLSLIK